MFRRIIQPTEFSCLGACACMASGAEFSEFEAFVGHDGSTAYYALSDVYSFLFNHGITLGGSAGFSNLNHNKAQPRSPLTLDDSLILPLFRLSARKKQNVVQMVNQALSEYLKSNNEPIALQGDAVEVVADSMAGIATFDNVVVKIPVKEPAILITNGFYENRRVVSHAVFWDGNRVLDPSPSAPDEPSLDKYTIIQWIPICIEKRESVP